VPESGLAASDGPESSKKIWPEILKTKNCSNPKKSRNSSTSEIPRKIQRLKEARKNSTSEEDSPNTALVSKNLHFTDDVPQQFNRSLHPASACIANAP